MPTVFDKSIHYLLKSSTYRANKKKERAEPCQTPRHNAVNSNKRIGYIS